MGKRTYTYNHTLGKEEALRRLEPSLREMAQKYGMAMESHDSGALRLHRKGVECLVEVTDDAARATVELSFLLEKTLRGTIEKRLDEEVPRILGKE